MGGQPFTEDDNANFDGSFYSLTKGMVEQMLKVYPGVSEDAVLGCVHVPLFAKACQYCRELYSTCARFYHSPRRTLPEHMIEAGANALACCMRTTVLMASVCCACTCRLCCHVSVAGAHT